MDLNSSIDKISEKINLIEKLYDYIRVVDVLNKKVNYILKPKTYKITGKDKNCYDFWKKGISCENCISARAYNENRAIFKIEYTENYVYLVSAVPAVFNDNKIIIEGLSDITNEGIMNIRGKEIGSIQKSINRINQLIVRDALSRIYNEQFIYEKLPYDILKSGKEKRNLALLFLKINNFQAINDLYGYKASNYVIREFSKLIKYYCNKSSDWAARLSRVEFIIVIFDLNEKQLYKISKHINDRINKLNFKYEGKIIKIELNIGYHIIHNENIAADEFIEKARKNLYPIKVQLKEKNPELTFEGLLYKFLFTEREREVSLLLLKGLSNNEISKKLFISISTVKKHITNILNKVKAKSRSDFIAKYANF